jgi:hypothetical protein
MALLCAAPSLRAQSIPFLEMSVWPTPQTVAPGDSPFWHVRLTNNTSDTAYFVLMGFQDGLGSVPDVAVNPYDPAPFGQPFTLAPNASLDLSNLFQTVVAPWAGSATYNSVAEALYTLYDSDTFANPLLTDVFASGDWSLTVQAAPSDVPEPGALALCAGMIVPGVAWLYCRRKTQGR